jgi:hypothetical protein
MKIGRWILCILCLLVVLSGCNRFTPFYPLPTLGSERATTTSQTSNTPSVQYLTYDKQEILHQLLFTNGDCEFPCFWGVTPGSTTWAYTQAFLGTFNDFNTAQPEYIDDTNAAYTVPIQFVDPNNIAVIIDITATIKDEIVQRLNIYTEMDSGEDISKYWRYYSLESLLPFLGIPDGILVYHYSYSGIHDPKYGLLLEFNGSKVAIWLSGEQKATGTICPEISTYSEIEIIQLSISYSESPADILPPNWRFWEGAAMGLDYYYPAEEALGVDSQDFYDEIVNGDGCFDLLK